MKNDRLFKIRWHAEGDADGGSVSFDAIYMTTYVVARNAEHAIHLFRSDRKAFDLLRVDRKAVDLLIVEVRYIDDVVNLGGDK